jgi:hypothetical protein
VQICWQKRMHHTATCSFTICPVERGRSRARSAGAMDVNEDTRAAQEIVDTLPVTLASRLLHGRGLSVVTVTARQWRLPGTACLESGQRGSSRIPVETDDDWEKVEDLKSTSPTVVWTPGPSPSQRQQFKARGWLSAGVSRSISAAVSGTFDPEEALGVSESDVIPWPVT